jgi:hypothetical protein
MPSSKQDKDSKSQGGHPSGDRSSRKIAHANNRPRREAINSRDTRSSYEAMQLSNEDRQIFCMVADLSDDGNFIPPTGAYNFRVNGESIGRNSTEHIDVRPKQSQSGLDIYIEPGTKDEQVHIPVAISATGLKEVVYNDFHIGTDADVTIIAGCGIYNCGPSDSVHDGVHRFYVGKNAIGVVQLLTLGGCGIWTLIDFILIVCGSYRDGEGKTVSNN